MKKIYLQPETDFSWLQSDKDWMVDIPGGIATQSNVSDETGQSFAPSRKIYI